MAIHKYSTIPNSITALRFIALPFIFYASVVGAWCYASVGIIFALITDVFDGYIARKLKQETSFGAFFDTVVDKVLIIGCLTILSYRSATAVLITKGLPWWFMSIILGRELCLLVGGLYILCSGESMKIKPSFAGKCIGGIIQLWVLGFFLVQNNIMYSRDFFKWIMHNYVIYRMLLMGIAAISFGVCIEYAMVAVGVINKRKQS